VTLRAATTLTSNSYIGFYGTLTTTAALTVAAESYMSFSGAVSLGAAGTFSGSAISFYNTLDTSGVLSVTTNGTSVWDGVTYKTGQQSYNGAVTLGAAATFTSNSYIGFYGRLTAAAALTASAESYMSYSGAVTLGAAATFTGSYINFYSTLDTSGVLTVTTNGTHSYTSGWRDVHLQHRPAVLQRCRHAGRGRHAQQQFRRPVWQHANHQQRFNRCGRIVDVLQRRRFAGRGHD